MIGARLEVSGLREAQETLRGMADRARNARPALEEVAEVFYRLEERRFRSRAGGRWPVLKERTRKRRKGRARVLRDTDKLYRSLTSRATGSIRRIGPDRMTLGTRVPYAKHLDKRFRLIYVDRRARRVFASHIAEWIEGGGRYR